MRGQHMKTNAAIFQCKRKQALEKETNSHFVGAYYPAMIAACYSFQTLRWLAQGDTRSYFKQASQQKKEDTISSKGCFLVPPIISY